MSESTRVVPPVSEAKAAHARAVTHRLWMKRLLQGQELVIAVIGIALAIFFSVYSSAFSTGSNVATLSSYVAPIMAVLAARLACVSGTLLGPPVVPLVCRMRARAPGWSSGSSAFSRAAAGHREQVAVALRRAGAAHLVLRTDGDWVADVMRFVISRKRGWTGAAAGSPGAGARAGEAW